MFVNKYHNDNRPVLFSLFFLIFLGVFLRSLGYFIDPISLWLDEAMWFERLYDNSVLDYGKRPIGYKIINKLLFQVGVSEPIIRLSSWLPSVLSLILVPFVAQKFFKAKTTIVLAVIFISTNPYIICHAKEFKPYSLELLCHLIVVYCCIVYCTNKKVVNLIILWGMFLVLVSFSYNLVFVLPSIFLLSCYSAYELGNKTIFMLLCVFGIIAISLFSVTYVTFLSEFNIEKKILRWGGKYDVFYLPIQEYFSYKHFIWILVKYKELLLASMAGKSSLSNYFDTTKIELIKDILFIGLHIFGLFALLLKKQLNISTILLLPLITLIIVHLSGWWLFGGFRTNLFILPYFLLVTLYGFDVFITNLKNDKNFVVAAVLVVFFVSFQFTVFISFYSFKNYWARHSNTRDALEYILEVENSNSEIPGKILVGGDIHSVKPGKYYLYKSEYLKEEFNSKVEDIKIKYLGKNEHDIIEKLKILDAESVWIVLNKNKFIESRFIFNFIKNNKKILYYYRYPKSTLIIKYRSIIMNEKTRREQQEYIY
ncbi:MAG: hypothetical protein GY705_24820 [Bacteroidetes bacterium]|nr:hypothetical protein [Bacteroidota bacterium]